MEYGILKEGDLVRYTEEAKLKLGSFADNQKHIVTKITVSDGLDDIDEDTTGNEHAEWQNSSGADVYWLEKCTW